MSVVNVCCGATTSSGAVVVAKVDGGGPVRVAVADNADMTDPVFFGPEAVDADDVAKVETFGLDSVTRYWYQIEDNSVLDTSVTGRFLTHPPAGSQASFAFAVSGDAGLTPDVPGATGTELAPDRISNIGTFDTVRTRALENDWLFFTHLGDLHYYDLGSGNHGIAGGGSLANYRTAYDDILLQPNQAQLYREVAWQYLWDDHDYGPNNSDGTFVDKANAAAAYRERAPHYPLPDSDAIYHSFIVGRVLFIASDVRYNRSPNGDPDDASKTMLGPAQKSWMNSLLGSSGAEVLVWLMPSQWLGSSVDSWDSFQTERDELVDLLDDHGWLDRMVMIYADQHAAGIDSGAGNSWGGFPIMQVGSMDATPFTAVPGRFNVLEDTPARRQYGVVQIDDNGSTISVRLEAWEEESLLGSSTRTFLATPPPPVPFNPALITGSHGVVFDVRVLETFQTGDDPQGTTIAFADEPTDLGLNVGEVEYDATRTIRGTAFVRVPGTFGTDGESSFPRGQNRLLAPFGNEIFIRYGIDLGETIAWTPLGYFGITDTHQDDSPNSPVEMFCHDRSYVIEISELIDPRGYSPPQTVGDVFDDLILDVFPDAIIVFDDATGTTPLGSQIVAEKNRWKPLVELADSFGKILFFDGEGVLRIETPPDPDVIVWNIKSNTDGVLIEAQRELSREGIFNAVVVEGEKMGESDPVRAVAINNDPNSPTRFGGRIGRVPTFLTTPLVSTTLQAQNAARFLLQRALGAPYTASTESIVNPALRPYEAVKIIYSNNERDEFIVDRVSIPLDEDAGMTIDMREKTLVVTNIDGG